MLNLNLCNANIRVIDSRIYKYDIKKVDDVMVM